jgi:hypothetical protein
MPDVYRAGRLSVLTDRFHETSELQHLFTATLQLMNRNLYVLQPWIERCTSYGQRPLIYIDEGQLLSSENEWGKIASVAEENNAHVVLLTGTPYRADCKDIPGFEIQKISRKDIERKVSTRINDKEILSKTYEGFREERILVPHYEITLREAWDIGALCKVETHWIDSTLKVNGDTKQLNELNKSDAAKSLRSVVTNRKTIKESLDKAVLDMRERRDAGMRNAGILVVTTSDIEDSNNDGLANWHARRVRDQIQAIDSSLDILIATQADGTDTRKSKSGAKKLKEFTEGRGDVLIVKNMGTVGLDCARLKTIVLLGTTRQLATWVQTILRGGTIAGNVSHFTLILTDDEKNRENWKFIVMEQGGSYSAEELVKTKEEIVQKDIEENPEDIIEIIKAEHIRTEDSHNTDIVTDESDVHRAIAQVPILRDRLSIVEIKALLKSGVIHVNNNPDSPLTGVVDTGSQCNKYRNEAKDLASDIVNRKATYTKGGPSDEWVTVRKELYKDGKRHAGILGSVPKETDPIKLKLLRDYFQQELNKLEARNG